MKKDIKGLFLLIITLSIISITTIIILGRTHSTSFNIHNKEYEFLLDGDTETVEIINKKEVDKNLIVKVKAKKTGKVALGINHDGFSEMKLLYVHHFNVITEGDIFGYSRGSEVIPISLSIILIYTLVILIKRYRYNIKENLYQYKNVAYLGIIIFLTSFILTNILSIINYNGPSETISKLLSSMTTLSIVLLPVAFITFILVTISNIKLIIKEGRSIKNLLGLFLGILICILTILPDRLYLFLLKSQTVNIFDLNGPGPYIYNFVESVIYLTAGYLECILIGTIIIAIKSIKRKVEYDKDYIIILGCQIKKDGTLTPLLKGRVDKALEFRNKQLEATGKDLKFIPSGGQGPNEIISEAEAIKKYLIANGIKEKNIILDDKSTNTYENIKFSNKLVKDKKAKVIYSTTNYHVLRAGLIATSQGLKLEGIGSKTKAYFWVNAFIREFVGTLYSEKKKHFIVIIIILLSIILMILITYFSNNI